MIKVEENLKTDFLDYVRNFEEEVMYISRNFNKSVILDFINVYRNYSSLNDIQMNFVCIVSEKFYNPLKVPECLNIDQNCCYIVRNALYIVKGLKYCNVSFLIKDYDIVCICYNFSKENNFYTDFICV